MRTRALLVLLLSPVTVAAQREFGAATTISVSATHSQRVAADRATIHFLVEGTGETSEHALQRVAQKLVAVRKAIADGGFAREAPAEFPYGLSQSQNNSGIPWPSNAPIPYTARTAVRVAVARLDQLPQLISTVLTAGVVSTSAPQFEFTGADTRRLSLLRVAIQKARLDAEALARGMNGVLGEPSQVTTYGPSGPGYTAATVNFNNRYDAGLQAVLPELVISAGVSINYRLVRR